MFYKMLGDVISNNREQINYNLQHARSFLRKLEAVIVEIRFLLIVYHTLCFLTYSFVLFIFELKKWGDNFKPSYFDK